MKKLYTILACGFLCFQTGKSFSQASFEFHVVDSTVYGDTLSLGDLECFGGYIRNKTANAITIDVVRVQNVNLATGWESYFCTNNQCYASFVDSVRFNLAAYDTTEFLPHFGTTATPDSQTVFFSVRNSNVPTDVDHKRFHGVTKIGYGLGMFEHASLANVNIYPSPLMSGTDFNINISSVNVATTNFSLIVYTMYGGIAKMITGLQEGNNTLNLDLAAGMYSYRLISGNTVIHTGEIAVVR